MGHFAIKAKEKERQYVKKLRSGAIYLTCKGATNFVHSVNENSIYVRSQNGKARFESRFSSQLQEAIRYMLYKRTATRKELEPYASFNSSLMGLLRLVFADIARVTRTV